MKKKQQKIKVTIKKILIPGEKYYNDELDVYITFSKERIKELFDHYEKDKTGMSIDKDGCWVIVY